MWPLIFIESDLQMANLVIVRFLLSHHKEVAMSTYYCGIDLHAKSCVFGVIDAAGHPVDEAKLPNDLEKILAFLSPYGPDLHIAIESTINWYWIVDGLQEAGYDVHLAHTLGLYMITGAKVKTDRRDAFKLAQYLYLDELPEAYIYPQDQRPLRDFLRRRIGLVEIRASCYTSLRIQLMRYNLNTLPAAEFKNLEVEDINALPIPGEVQDYGAMLLQRIEVLSRQIHYMDDYLKTVTVADPLFQHLLTIPGVWYTLGLTIYYEIGEIDRFASPRRFASYCRLVPSLAQSDQTTRKGRGKKQGNRYLKWAFTQAANIAVRYYPPCRKFRDKHANKRSGSAATMVANCILAHKLATATYHILKEDTPFEMNKLFG